MGAVHAGPYRAVEDFDRSVGGERQLNPEELLREKEKGAKDEGNDFAGSGSAKLAVAEWQVAENERRARLRDEELRAGWSPKKGSQAESGKYEEIAEEVEKKCPSEAPKDDMLDFGSYQRNGTPPPRKPRNKQGVGGKSTYETIRDFFRKTGT